MITEGSYYRRVTCPTCGRGFSVTTRDDYLCYACKRAAWGASAVGTIRDGSVWDGRRWHQLTPRLAVEGDIYPEPAALYWNKERARAGAGRYTVNTHSQYQARLRDRHLQASYERAAYAAAMQQRARVEELEKMIAVLRLTLEELAAKLKPT